MAISKNQPNHDSNGTHGWHRGTEKPVMPIQTHERIAVLESVQKTHADTMRLQYDMIKEVSASVKQISSAVQEFREDKIRLKASAATGAAIGGFSVAAITFVLTNLKSILGIIHP